MEFHGLRQSSDIDCLLSEADFDHLALWYPNAVFLEAGVPVIRLDRQEGSYEFHRSVLGYGYTQFKPHTQEGKGFLVLSPLFVLLLKCRAIPTEKNQQDASMLATLLLTTICGKLPGQEGPDRQ